MESFIFHWMNRDLEITAVPYRSWGKQEPSWFMMGLVSKANIFSQQPQNLRVFTRYKLASCSCHSQKQDRKFSQGLSSKQGLRDPGSYPLISPAAWKPGGLHGMLPV
jgi:hypothetical protein